MAAKTEAEKEAEREAEKRRREEGKAMKDAKLRRQEEEVQPSFPSPISQCHSHRLYSPGPERCGSAAAGEGGGPGPPRPAA